jgi:RNA polymerase sigma factor (sigma-70 family)
MARLAESDYRKALEVLYAAGENDGTLPFGAPVLDALRDLVPCDVVAYHERSGAQDRAILYVGEPAGELSDEVRAAHRRFAHEDPLRPIAGAQTLTDLVPLREFRRCDFYRYVHRPLGIEYMLSLFLDPQVTDARFDFDRSESDFTERDRKVLNLVLPHLRQFLHAGRRRLRADRARASLSVREREVLVHVAEGLTNAEVAHALTISPETVRKHLENAYEKLGVHTRTAAVAAIRD